MSPGDQNTLRAQRTPDGTCFDVTGNPQAPVIVLIHGLGLCRELWTQHLPALEQDFRVINYDLFGHGDSDPLTDSPDNCCHKGESEPKAASPASLSVYAKQIVNLLDYLSINKAALVGFSIGGMINRRVVMDYPHRVSSLVILNSPHERGEKLQQQVESRAKQVGNGDPMATLPDALIRWFTKDYLDLRDQPVGKNSILHGADRVSRWRQQVESKSYAGAAWVLANGVRELIKPQPPIECPALVLTAENDTGSTSAMSQAIAAEIEGAELILLPHLQHLGLLEQPEIFTNPVVDFLRRHELQESTP